MSKQPLNSRDRKALYLASALVTAILAFSVFSTPKLSLSDTQLDDLRAATTPPNCAVTLDRLCAEKIERWRELQHIKNR